MFRSGVFVADQLGSLDAEQVQPNGVDLTLGGVLEQQSPGRISQDGKSIGERRTVRPTETEDGAVVYELEPGGYIVQYADTVSIPEEHIGFIYPRSSLLRNSCMLDTAVWDAGYEGNGEGLLEVYHPVELEEGARIAQLVLADAAHESVYDGDYQNEQLE